MSLQNKRHLANINDSLRAEHNNLKVTKDHLLDHIGGLIKRQKQLNKLKLELSQELTRSQEKLKIEQKTKQPLCLFLKEQLSQLDKKYIQENLKLRNLENQYQVCLQDYQKVIELVTHLIDGASGIEGELSRLKESDITMKAMIFDCERLKRVMEEQRRYFRQLCTSEQRSHAQRLKQLESIRKNIIEEEDSSTFSIRLSKLHIGIMKLGSFFDKKILNYKDSLLRQQARQAKVVKIGIKSFFNCVNVAEIKMRQNKRTLFRKWHNNAFPKSILKDITQRALRANENSRIRLKILGVMSGKLLEKNTELLHLFQKIKYFVAIANKFYRKDKHYGFNIWREQARGAKRIENIVEKAFGKVIPNNLKRNYFNQWNKSTNLLRRFQMASILLNQFQNTKQTARVFRKWRFQILNHEARCIRFYMRRLHDQQKLTKRIKYEKRKMKILTTLHMKVTKIKLRNYFIRYWANAQSLKGKAAIREIEEQRQIYSETRKAFLKEQNVYASKDKALLITIFRDFVYKCKIVPAYKQWKNQAQHFKKQKRAVLSLVLRKQAKNKIYVMNEFRKCVQYYQKKEMHQVLTDLNHKMQTINEKSTQFRESLKNCIQNLGVIASKKLDYVSSYIQAYQKRMVYNQYNNLRIKKAYKLFLLARMFNIFYSSCCKQTFTSIQDYIKQNQQQIEAQKKAVNYFNSKSQALHTKIFSWIKRQALAHNKGFSMLIHIENVFIFYRMTYAFAAVKRVYTAQKYKAMYKHLEDQGNVLKQRQENMMNLKNTRAECQNSLKQFFGKFVTYEDRKAKIKIRQRTHHLLSKYLSKFRKICSTQILKEKGVENIGNLVMNHNQYMFFRNLMVIRYEQLLQEVKEELAKINKKRKTFQEKNSKIRADMEKRIEEEIKVYNQCKQYYQFYSTRFEGILNFYEKRTATNEANYLSKQIFLTWKYEYVTSKRLINAIVKVYRRKFLKQPCDIAMKELRGRINKAKSAQMLAVKLENKGNKLILHSIDLWKANIKKMKQYEIEKRIDSLDEYEDEMKEQIKDRAQLISNEFPRVSGRQLIAKVFMGFKQVWLKLKTNKRKVLPMLQRRQANYKKDAMVRWKWLMFYKHTKRSYLKFKKNKYELQLKRDVFGSLKHYRFTIFNILNKIKAANTNQLLKMYQFCFDKIRNEAAEVRDELHYERRRALHTILSAKIAKLMRIKQKILMKWNAHLIPRLHYLPSIIKRCELNVLKSAFANINEKKYWNQIYIKAVAQEVTSDGYNEINQITNSLMRQGYDPDQIKQYLKKRNDKDTVILDKVIRHFKAWPSREPVVRAFHSWKQYLILKQNIKRALKKVFNIAGGIGKYWARWRTKDPHFNQILKKESRGNMLNRYRQLSRLLKEYHRDIRDNSANLEELKEINQQYKDKNRMAIVIALNSLSNSVKKGVLQGLNIWRGKIYGYRRSQMDERYDQIISGLEMLTGQRNQKRYTIEVLKEQNKQLKEKCMWGVECGKILQHLLTQKDSLSIDLADKEHNLKLLLQDNLRLKQKMKLAKSHAQKLIRKVEEQKSSSL